jgi:hypothetical protein
MARRLCKPNTAFTPVIPALPFASRPQSGAAFAHNAPRCSADAGNATSS